MSVPNRPKYLNLIQIRLPVPGIVSIAHRISGVLMFLAIPFFAYLLQLSIDSERGFREASLLMDDMLVKLALFCLIWSLLHHLFAGIRYLLIDMDVGVERPAARASAMMVIIAGIVAAVVIGAILL